MKTNLQIFLFFLLMVISYSGSAQNIQETKDLISAYLKSQINIGQKNDNASSFKENIVPILDSIYGNDHSLETGKLYSGYYGFKGHPFLYEEAIKGQITIEGATFSEVGLLYDIYRDQVICQTQNNSLGPKRIIINKLDIVDFKLNDKYFINLFAKNANKGFFELIYQGENFSLLAKWSKTESREISNKHFNKFSEANRSLYLIRNDRFEEIKNKKNFFSFLGIDRDVAKKIYPKTFPKLSQASNQELKELVMRFDKHN